MARIARVAMDADDLDVGEYTLYLVDDGIIEGAEGPPGPQGEPGTPGQPRFVGDGAPGTIIGAVVGDHYLDRQSGVIYQLGA